MYNIPDILNIILVVVLDKANAVMFSLPLLTVSGSRKQSDYISLFLRISSLFWERTGV